VEKFVSISQGIVVCGKIRQPFGNFGDDGAKLGIAIGILLAELFGVQVDFREEALKSTGKGFVFNVIEGTLQGMQ